MRMRMALWSITGAVWLLTAVTLAQAVPPAAGKKVPAKSAPAPESPPGDSKAGKTPKGEAPAGGAAPAGAGDAAAQTTGGAAATGGATNGAAPAATSAASESTAPMDAGTYTVRLRDLEQRINDLKERVFRSKSRLSLVGEVVLPDVIGGSKTVIVHENRMSHAYDLVSALYVLDGTPIFNRADEKGGLSKLPKFDVFNGRIVPGEHSLEVTLKYRGNGFGPFSYLKDYHVTVTGRRDFSAPADTAVSMRVNAYEKGGPTAAIGDRPTVAFKVDVANVGPGASDEDEEDDAAASAPAGAAGAGSSGSTSLSTESGAATGTVDLTGAAGGK